MPCCCILISIYCDLSGNSYTLKKNQENDCMINYKENVNLSNKIPYNFIVGKWDKNGQATNNTIDFNPDLVFFDNNNNDNNNNNNKNDTTFCPLFFMVAENEVLLGDTLQCVKNVEIIIWMFKLKFIHIYVIHIHYFVVFFLNL